MAIVIAIETPLQDEVRTLVAELNAVLLELTPTEARDIARWFHGFVHELAQTDAANRAMVLCHELSRELKEARREIRALRVHAGVTDVEQKQMALLG